MRNIEHPSFIIVESMLITTNRSVRILRRSRTYNLCGSRAIFPNFTKHKVAFLTIELMLLELTAQWNYGSCIQFYGYPNDFCKNFSNPRSILKIRITYIFSYSASDKTKANKSGTLCVEEVMTSAIKINTSKQKKDSRLTTVSYY